MFRSPGRGDAVPPACMVERGNGERVNSFDSSIILYVNQFARRSALFDEAIRATAQLDLLKGGLFIFLFAWFWCTKAVDRQRHREVIFATIVASFCAIILGRLLALGLPFRVRPMNRTDIAFVAPYGEILPFRGWSAFPSDHAMLFAALATGLWFISPVVGLVMHVYAATFIGLPRLYLGWHHPTDLLGGAALGILLGVVANSTSVRPRITRLPLRLAEVRPSLFYALSIFVLSQLANMFYDVRTVAKGGAALARYCACRSAARADCDVPSVPEHGSTGCPPPAREDLVRPSGMNAAPSTSTK
jgi:membrane-associated phospholipid phosphatase